jgi:diaminopropionate ammonia-lyase
VQRALRRAGRSPSSVTVTCATDGNHGKSVAWGARTFGCKCVVYVHAGVSRNRRDAIAAYGAEVRVVEGTYDDAVRRAAEDAARGGWTVVSDTSYEGYTDTPRDVMQGYGLIALEADRQLPAGTRPTHVFAQAGVGGLAASLCAYYWESRGDQAPVFAVAEPDTANCLQLSAKAGKATTAPGSLDTMMAGLACGEPSLLAWRILSRGADAFLTLDDPAAAETMRLLADPPFGDPGIVAGESAVAGLAGFLLAAADEDARRKLRLTEKSVVLVVGTEGATDPDLYRKITGRACA